MKTSHTIYTSFAKRLAIILTLLFTLGVTSAWATEYEEMLVLDVAKNAPTGSTTTAMEADAILSYLENASETKNEIKSVTDVSGKVYKGKGTGGDGIPQACLKIGKASEAAGFTFTIADTFDDVSKVTIIGYGWKTSTAVSVNESAGQKPTHAATEVSFDYVLTIPTKTIKIYVGSSAFCATQIILYKEAASKCAYTVTFNSNYGTNSTYSQEFTCDVAQNLTANSFSRTGHTFAGWNTEADGSGTSYTNQQSVNLSSTNNDNFPLYAQWTANTYTVQFDANGGTGTMNDQSFTYGTAQNLTLNTFEKYGHTFAGWSKTSNGSIIYTDGQSVSNLTSTNTATVTLYAKWTEKALTNYRTSCTEPCEQLGVATGLSVQTDYVDNGQTYVKFSWTPADNTKSHATKQVICIGKVGEEKKCTDLEGNQVWSGDLRSKLTPGEYEWTIQAIGDGETYCDGEVISGPNFTIEEPLTDNCRWVEIALEDITPEDEIVVTMGNDEIGYALGTEKITNSPKSQAITITSGMIDINQDFDYSKYTWSISAVTGGYTLQPYGSDQYLYGVASYITISSTPTTFSIFEDSENGNKCFAYLINYKAYFLGHGIENEQTAWKRLESSSFLSSNTLKLYKKTCLPANKFWIDYELANVTCTNTPPHSQIDQTGEDLLLEFSANDGYKLPESISVSIGNNILADDNDVYIWDSENGVLLISAKQVTDNITISISGCEQLAAPTGLASSNLTSSSVTLSWNSVQNAESYTVYVTDGTNDITQTTSECNVTISGLTKNTLYTWDVIATADGYCENEHSQDWIEFTTLDVYTVTFNSNGGTAVESQPVDHGSKATKPANPTKTGYTFAGWYTEADTEFDFNTPITSPTAIYAKWNANQYTITFRQQWGDGGTETATVHFDNNDFSVSPIIVPTRNGYTFGGYYTAESGTGTQVIDVSGAWLNAPTYIEGGKWVYADNLTLYAKWTQNFTITWMANGQPYHSQTAMMGTAIAKPDNPDANEFACDDKVFVGWLDKTISGSTNEEPTFVTDFGTIQANDTYYAVFATLTGTPSNDYNKITNINDLTDGEYVIAYSYDGGTQVVLKNTTKDAKYMNASALAPSSNKYTSPSAEYIWQLQKQDDGSYYMYNSSVNKFLYATTSALQLSDNPTKYNISYDNTYSHWKIKLSDNASYYMHGYVSGSSYDFRVSTSGSGNKYRVYLYKNASTAVYSEYVTTCVEIPEPVWNGAEISHSNIKVNCGEYTTLNAADPNNGPATISFPVENNLDLTYPITLTVTEGNFLLSTNKTDYSKYTTSVEVAPNKTGDNVGKITQNVYVIAIAPAGLGGDFTGTITISGQQIATQTITVTAEVSCTQYTLTFNDQGQTKTVEGFAGTSVVAPEPWAETCSEPFQYVFDGWATEPVTNGAEEYEKVDFSTFTMPNNNTTILYAVYRYAEEGGEPVNGYVKVTEALADWSGDYVIVNETAKKAIGNAYANKNANTLTAVDVEIEDDKVISPSENVIWQIRKSGSWYTMYNATAEKYAYITQDKSEAAGLDNNSQNLSISFNNGIVKIYGETIARCFSYYSTNTEWRVYSIQTYSTGALYRLSNKTIRYTSSLVCGSIEAENAIVTSTVGQIVKVNVPITLNYSEAASITGTSDNEAFTVVTKNDVAVGESTIEVHYKPTAYVNTANQEETATITLTTSNGATTTFNVTGRCLPEAFVIAAKWGNNWYALPANMSSETTVEGLLIEVDNPTNPAKAIAAPNTTKYSLKAVYKSNQSADRFAEFGNRLVFVEEVEEATPVANKTLYNGGGDAQNSSRTNIQVYAQYSGYYNSNPDRYEWIPTTTDLKDYTLTSAHVFTGEAARTISLDNHGVFGTLLQNKSYNGMVRLLPVESFYTPTELQVVEWKEDGVSIMYTGSGTKATTKVGNNDEGDVQLLSEKKIDHAVYTLSTSDLIAATNQVLTISIKGDDGNIIGTHKMTIPWILNSSKSSDEIASEVTQATDIVVLNGAILTAANTKYTYDDVVVYPGGKLVIGVDGKLGMYSLTFRLGSSWGAAEYEHKYPEFVLNTTTSQAYSNTSGKINLDYVTTKEQYYTFVAPFEVYTKHIKYPVDIYGSNVAANNTGSFEFQYYDGEARAAGERGWTVVDEDPTEGATLTAHQGYTFYGMPKKVSVNGGTSTRQKFGIHRIPMTVTAAKAMTHENDAQTVAISAHPSEKNINSGWNLIGNPYMSTITGLDNQSIVTGTIVMVDNRWEWSNDETYNQRFIVFPSNDGEWYYTSQASNATLPAFKNFFVQIDNEANALSIPYTHRASGASAPARRLAEDMDKDIELAIVLEQDDKYADQMDFLLNDAYSAVYDRNADFTKMMNNTNFNLFGVHMDDYLSFVAIDTHTARSSVAIGYQVPQAGQYTLRLSDKPYVMWSMVDAIYVTDHEVTPKVTTNLLDEAYTFQVSNVETNTTRFTISIVPSKESGGTTTAVDDILHQDIQTQKFIYNDQLYILRGGVVYDAMGQRVTTINQ